IQGGRVESQPGIVQSVALCEVIRGRQKLEHFVLDNRIETQSAWIVLNEIVRGDRSQRISRAIDTTGEISRRGLARTGRRYEPENPAAQAVGRHDKIRGAGLLSPPHPVVIHEEEGLVSADGSADGAAELIAPQRLAREALAVIEEGIGVESRVARK